MIDFKRVFFGYADANTEAERNPLVFKRVFFDPHDYINELVYADRFLLIGRKGAGKSAYGAQIKLISDEKGFYSYQRSLSNFNNLTFSTIKSYDKMGGNPYISFWKCVLLIEYVRMLYAFEPHIQTPEFSTLLAALEAHGFIAKDNDISTTVMKLVEADTSLNLQNVIQHSRKYLKTEVLHGAEEIYSAIKNSICNIYLKKSFVLTLDGLDDILYSTEFKAEIITGLIRAVEEINRVFSKSTLKAKTIVLIRDDILNLCRDPNLSKIVRDSGIRLSWEIENDPFESDLIELVARRVYEVEKVEKPFHKMWREVFPENIGTRNSIDYILDNIIYRPRDLLQFFIEAQKQFSPGKQLTVDKIRSALVRYSEDYFIDAMRDELTGFFPDDVVTMLPEVLSKMGTRYFYQDDFEAEFHSHKQFEMVSGKEILEQLFAAGYIGQRRPRESRDYTVFSYRNSREKYQPEDECIVHRGLTRALTI